jgi:hypothetical protein
MAALTGPRLARSQTVKTIMLPLKGSATAYRGGMCAADTANGWVLPATQAAGLLNIGQFEADNNNSANTGTSFVNVTLSREFEGQWYDNATGANAVVASNLFATCYILDDHTVTMSTGSNGIAAGRVWALDPLRGVLVQPTTF